MAANLKPGEVPFQPWAEAEYKRRVETLGKDDPNNLCLPSRVAATGCYPTLQPDTELLEYICEENNRDAGHFVGK